MQHTIPDNACPNIPDAGHVPQRAQSDIITPAIPCLPARRTMTPSIPNKAAHR